MPGQHLQKPCLMHDAFTLSAVVCDCGALHDLTLIKTASVREISL